MAAFDAPKLPRTAHFCARGDLALPRHLSSTPYNNPGNQGLLANRVSANLAVDATPLARRRDTAPEIDHG